MTSPKTRDLVDARVYYSQPEAVEAVAKLKAHGVECRVIPPAGEPLPSAAAPYRLQVQEDALDRVASLLGDQAYEPEPDFADTDQGDVHLRGIEPGLKRIRRGRALVLASIGLMVLTALMHRLLPHGLIVLAGAVVLHWAISIWAGRALCPRCGKRFHRFRHRWMVPSTECGWCQQPL